MLRGQNARDSANSQSSDGSSEEPPPTCSCDCCDVTIRRPGEISFGAKVKCTPSSQHTEDMCGAQCSPAKEDKILQDDIVDMQRFCFFECKPAAGAGAPVSSQCVALADEEVSKVIDPAGNPIDPAFLYSQPLLNQQPPASFFYGTPPGASANLLSTHATISQAPLNYVQAAPAPAGVGVEAPTASKSAISSLYSAEAQNVDITLAKKDALKGKAFSEKKGGEAMVNADALRNIEERKQYDLNEALQASGNGEVSLDPLAAIADLKAATLSARAAASQANVYASDAIGAYDVGRQKIWKLALDASAKEVLRWKKYAEEKTAKELKDRFAPTFQTKAAAAAQKASQPYIEGMLRAQESVKLYNTKGFDMASQARALWDEAQADAKSANELPRRTIRDQNKAQAAILDAREKAKNAQHMAVESKQYFATATNIRKGIPAFQYNAQKAAAQAVAELEQQR